MTALLRGSAHLVAAAAWLAVSASLPAQDIPLPDSDPSALSTRAAAPALRIVGQSQVASGHLVRLEIEGLPVGATAFWDADGTDGKRSFEGDGQEVGDGRYFVFTGPPGIYSVKAICFPEGNRPVRVRGTAVITADPNAPTPVNPVDPNDPVKPPAPVAGPLWVITLAESKNITPAHAAVLADKALWDAVAKAGHKYRQFDPTDATTGGSDAQAAASAVSIAKKAGVTGDALILAKPTGEVVRCVPLPETGQAVWSLVKEVTGK